MKKIIQAVSSVILLGFLAACTPGGGTTVTQQMKAADFFMKNVVGNNWVYVEEETVTNPGQQPVKTIFEVTQILTGFVDGVATYSVERKIGGATVSVQSFSQQLNLNGALVSDDSVVLPPTFSLGTKWVMHPGLPDPSLPDGNGRIDASIGAVNVTRTTPAGTFADCVEVNYGSRSFDTGSSQVGGGTLYFCQSAGMDIEDMNSMSETLTFNGVSRTFLTASHQRLQSFLLK